MHTFRAHYTRKLARHILVLLLIVGLPLFAGSEKISPDLQPLLLNPSNSLNVIVQYNSPPQQQQSSGGLLGDVLGGAIHLLSGVISGVFSIIPGVLATVHPADVIALSNQSNVDYISLDRPVAATLDYTAATVNAPIAWSAGWDGTGVGIAVIDSGIYAHPDLTSRYSTASRVVYRQSFVNGVNKNDDYGHGTHVAGIIAGDGKLSTGSLFTRTFKGIAPNAKLIDLRVLDANGGTTDSAVIAAIQQAVALKSKYNIRVINLSLGRPIYESYHLDPLCQAVEAAWRNGIVVVVAAGNLGRNGYATVLAPGNDPSVITVGAMKSMATVQRSDDNIASYSSKGPSYVDLVAKPDVVAPGNLVSSLLAPGSTLANTYPGNVIPASYYSTNPGAPARVPSFKRHQHGNSSRQRHGRPDAAERSHANAGHDQSAAHEDGVQNVSAL